MEELKQRILKDGKVKPGNILKVDNFLNHQIDISFLNRIGQEFKKEFDGKEITKILTVEASGIAIASITAQYFDVPVLFAKKTQTKNIDGETYQSEVYSYTRDMYYTVRVAKKFLHSTDKVLIIDDFLANGQAALALKDIIDQAGAELMGVGIVIEKGFQLGGKLLREKGVDVRSLAIVSSMSDDSLEFSN